MPGGGPGLRAPSQKAPAPPARKAIPAAPAAAASDNAARLKARTDGLIGLVQIGAFLATVRGQFADVGAISQYGQQLAEETAAVGEEVEWLGNTLDMLAAAGPYTKLLTIAMPFGLQLMANRGKLDWRVAHNLGVVDPVILAERARQEIRAMADQQAREAEEASLRFAREQQEREAAQRERMYANGSAPGTG